MKKRIVPAILLAVLLLGGCTGMNLQPPSVTVAGIEVIGANLFEQRLAFKLRVLNPNPVEIPIKGRLMIGSSSGLNFDERGRLEMPQKGQGR